MRALLDTHIALWAIAQPGKLSDEAYQLLSDEANLFYVSAVSVWEIALKHEIHPDLLSMDAEDFSRLCTDTGFLLLDLKPDHILMYQQVVHQLFHDHKDPFDRLLVTQAKSEGLRFATHDAQILKSSDSSLIAL